MLVCKAVNSIQFSSVHFDLITQETVLHASPTDRRFSCRSWAPLVGDGAAPLTILAGRVQFEG